MLNLLSSVVLVFKYDAASYGLNHTGLTMLEMNFAAYAMTTMSSLTPTLQLIFNMSRYNYWDDMTKKTLVSHHHNIFNFHVAPILQPVDMH